MEQPLNRLTTTVAEVDKAWRACVASMEHVLYRFYNDLDELCVVVQDRMNAFQMPFVEGRIQMLKVMNAIDEQLFDAMMATSNGGIFATNSILWSKLVSSGVIIRQFTPNMVAHSDWVIDHVKLSKHLDEGTLHNLFFPPSELILRYSEKVVAIDVVDQSGKQFRGSGFIVGKAQEMGPAETHPQIIVTCKHNLEGKTLQAITTSSGASVNATGPVFSEKHDLAFLQTDPAVYGQPPIAPTGEVEVFDEVFTLGFPSVPMAQSALLGHRGEVNARVERYLDKDEVLIISNLVAPGSSGGPVLDRAGRCVGMTIQWLEGEYEGGGYSRFSAAMPRSVIVAELIRHGLFWS